jgi:PadR family transcriptional regulator
MPGTLDMLILKTLTRGVMHGYGIAQHIKLLSEEVLQVEEGSLYPALQSDANRVTESGLGLGFSG